jgi:serine O-acetyltransferase
MLAPTFAAGHAMPVRMNTSIWFRNLRADYQRYLEVARADYGPDRAWLVAAVQYGFIAGAVYRYGRWTRTIRPMLLSLPFKLVYRILEFMVHVLFGIRISTNARIGPGLYIGHFGGITVRAKIGSNCSIAQGVTIGAKGAGRSNGYPQIGDRVYLGAGSMVIGHVAVGNDVVIGANTVVVHDVPDRCRVVSAPARILPPLQAERRERQSRHERRDPDGLADRRGRPPFAVTGEHPAVDPRRVAREGAEPCETLRVVADNPRELRSAGASRVRPASVERGAP